MSFDKDFALALQLQEQFHAEISNESKQVLKKFRSSGNAHNTDSLIDPVWETTDPTPDIHALFIAFNEHFFWSRLVSVEVRWSPRMTLCAGVCVYEGRQGLCSVRLSAPLLKLRPRSDLVETLLHEMIHAYLFVTNNDRDRDSHGPEFHKHMHRINNEAGTKISVYHDFHDEVRLYKQHWWRCDGPCRMRHPYFGMVKRAMNRAPGPNDFWWADHQASCGGIYHKVHEPEKKRPHKQPTASAKIPKSSEVDIRTYMASTGNSQIADPSSISKKSHTISQPFSTICGKENIIGFKSLNNIPKNVAMPNGGSKPNRVVGFGDLESRLNVPIPAKVNGKPLGGRPVGGHGTGSMLANRGGGTLVITAKKGNLAETDVSKSNPNPINLDPVKLFSGSGQMVGSGANMVNDRSKSRLLMLDATAKLNTKKPANDCVSDLDMLVDMNDSLIDCLDDQPKELSSTSYLAKCPVCAMSMPRVDIYVHLENCSGLLNVFNNSASLEISDDEDEPKKDAFPCPCCSKIVKEADMYSHIDNCLSVTMNCPLCNVSLVRTELDVHLQACSSSSLETAMNTATMNDCNKKKFLPITDITVQCPCCSIKVQESNVNQHLDDCLSFV